MSKLKELVEWCEYKRELSRQENKRGQVLAYAHTAEKARALLKEEAEQKPVEERVEGLCGTCNGSGMVQIGPNIRGMKTCETCKGKGKIAGHRPVKEEPLAVLADRKGCFLGSQWNGKEHYIKPFPGWRIDVIKKDGSWAECCTGDTYPAAEQAARKYLESLPDRNETKEGA